MPNWVDNACSFEHATKEDIEKIIEVMSVEDGISFQKLVPMPHELDITSPANTEEEKRQAKENMKKYGAPDWYQWRLKNWGTKWDACNGYINSYGFGCQTAWSMPDEFMVKLSKKFPNVGFRIRWADEDMGYNVGEVLFENGEITETNIPDGGSPEAYAMAFVQHDIDDDQILEWKELGCFSDDDYDEIIKCMREV